MPMHGRRDWSFSALGLGKEQDEDTAASQVDRSECHEQLPAEVGLHGRGDFSNDEVYY